MFNFNDFGRKWQLPAMLAFGTLPIPLIICAEAIPGSMMRMVSIAAVYNVLAWLCMVIRGKLRLLAGLVACGVLAWLSLVLLPMSGAALVVPGMYILLLLGGLRFGGWEYSREMNPAPGLICLALHAVGQILVNQRMEMAGYAEVRLPMFISFLGYAALALLAMNRGSMHSAVNGRDRAPLTMRRKNVLMTMGLMAITVLIAALPAVIEAARRAWYWLWRLILIIVEWLLKLFPASEVTGGSEGGMPGLPAMEASEPSLFAQILEKIIMVITLAAIAVLALFVLRMLWRKLKVLLVRLWARLGAYLATSTEDYVDEVTDTRDGMESEPLLHRLRRRAAVRRVDERTLAPAARIRHRYRLLGLKHPEWKIDSTARENIALDAAKLYERARYSTHEVTDRDADDFSGRIG